jgi:Ca2+-binding EF-hand superfamily protein
MAEEVENAAAAAPEGEEGEEENKDQTKKWDLDAATIESINETFDNFDKLKEEKIPSESLGSVLRWLGFNPTER